MDEGQVQRGVNAMALPGNRVLSPVEYEARCGRCGDFFGRAGESLSPRDLAA